VNSIVVKMQIIKFRIRKKSSDFWPLFF